MIAQSTDRRADAAMLPHAAVGEHRNAGKQCCIDERDAEPKDEKGGDEQGDVLGLEQPLLHLRRTQHLSWQHRPSKCRYSSRRSGIHCLPEH